MRAGQVGGGAQAGRVEDHRGRLLAVRGAVGGDRRLHVHAGVLEERGQRLAQPALPRRADDRRAGQQRLPGLVAAQHRRAGQAELLGDGRAEAGVREVAVPVTHWEVFLLPLSVRKASASLRPKGGQDSRMATTPWPPAAQMEIRPRLPGPASCSIFASWATIRPPVAANGCPAASDEPLTLSFDRSIEPSGASRPSLLLAERRVLPRLQRREHRGGERLVDLVEVEVLQASGRCGPASPASRRPAPSAGPRRRARSRRRRSARRPGGRAPAGPARRPTRRRRAARWRRRRSAASSCPPSSWRPRPCRTPA